MLVAVGFAGVRVGDQHFNVLTDQFAGRIAKDPRSGEIG